MKRTSKNIIQVICCLCCSVLFSAPLQLRAQIASTSVLVLKTPVIDSVGYHCSGGLPVQVYVSNQIAPVVYSIQSTVPPVAPIPTNHSGTFFNVYGITDAVFRAHNGSCYTDMAVHFDCGGDPLPVTLLDFTAKLYQDNKALLNWTVSREDGLARYEVEESTDGRTFKYLGAVVPVNGQGPKDYEFTDDRLEQGYNFYRLRMVDQDGSVQYSAVRFVIYSRDGTMVWYPNPTSRYLYMEFYNDNRAETIDIRIYNSISGNESAKQQYKLERGLNKLAVDVSLLPDGSYFLMYSLGGDRRHEGTIRFQKVSQ
jgi:hypothetical protein